MKNTIENNELIAEFMGMRRYDNFGYGDENWWCYPEKEKNPGCGFFSPLVYDKDWNWLMDVIYKIEDLGFGFEQYKNSCSITQDNTDDFWIINTQGETKMEATYKAVIEFIQQYNKNS